MIQEYSLLFSVETLYMSQMILNISFYLISGFKMYKLYLCYKPCYAWHKSHKYELEIELCPELTNSCLDHESTDNDLYMF